MDRVDDQLLAPFLDAPDRTGILTDFDGTLAPIVEDPTTSRPLPEAVDALHELARRYRRVAVISGRPAEFLATHLDLAGRPEGVVAVGLYGLERADGDEIVTHPDAADWRAVIADVADLGDEAAPPGVIMERKGLSLTVHYRTSPTSLEWARSWVAEQAERTGLVRHGARMSEELRPPVAVDKGSALGELAEGLGAVCFFGDDVGDLPAFAVLDRLAGEGVTTLKVGVRSEEAPPELLDAADVVVEGPEGVVSVFSRLLEGPAPR